MIKDLEDAQTLSTLPAIGDATYIDDWILAVHEDIVKEDL